MSLWILAALSSIPDWMHESADKSTDLNARMPDSVISVSFQSWLI
jgi:hypothetical protein